ncbi:MAG: glycosyltransferase [Bacteroides sp.]
MQFSVIIPAYNAAQYLVRCIESVANQDLPHDCYEAIVVNDGSTDDTTAVLTSLCYKYSFLRVIATVNGGLSKARNRGMEEATGEYLIFLDADDSIASHSFSTIYAEMTGSKLDMMLLNYVHIASNGTILPGAYPMERNPSKIVSGRVFLLMDCYPPMIPLYVYRSAFLKQNSLKMIPIWHEDEEFTPRTIYLAQRIKYFAYVFYNYYQHADSYTNRYNETHALNMLAAMASLKQFRQTFCRNDKNAACYFDNHIAVIVMRLFKNSIRKNETSQDEMIRVLKVNGLLPLKPQKSSFYFWLFNTSPILFVRYYWMIKHKYNTSKQ